MTKSAYIKEIRDPNLFQTLCQTLIHAEYPDMQLVDDASGDSGIDAYVPSIHTLFAMYCPEKVPARKESYQNKIREDVSKAVKLRDDLDYSIDHFVLLTPGPMTEELQRYLKNKATASGFTGANKSETYLTTLFAKHPGLRSEFPELCVPNIEAKIDSLHTQIGSSSRSFSLYKLKAIAGVAMVVIPTALYFWLFYLNAVQYGLLKAHMAKERAELHEMENLRERYQVEKRANMLSDLEYYKRVTEVQDKFSEFSKRNAARKSIEEVYAFYGSLQLFSFPVFVLLMVAGGLLMRKGFRHWHDAEQKYESGPASAASRT